MNDWREYLHAADRKILMAAFHVEALQEALDHDQNPSTLDPDLPIQAHFEGVMYSLIAAADQVAAAIDLGFGLELAFPVNLQRALKAMPDSRLRSALLKWHRAPIAADVRDIRRLATHHHYVKAPGELRREVQIPTRAKPYLGPRSLDGYAKAAAEHAGRLTGLIARLEQAILPRGRGQGTDG